MFISTVYILMLLFQIYGVEISFAKEPMCSKFPYEEQLLEKMIRIEIKVETMENEIKKTQASVLDTLNEIKKKVNDINDKFEDLRIDVTEELATTSKHLELMKQDTNRSAIGFHAYHVTDTVLVTNKIIVFDRSRTHEGSGYDTSTGIYTAPASGLYTFSVHICTSTGKFAFYGVVLDNIEISKGSHYDKDYNTCNSQNIVVSVKKGQQVWVHCTYGGGSSYRLYEDSQWWNSFSGALLSN